MDYQNADTDSAQDLQSAKNNLSASDKNGDQALKKVKTDTPTNRIEEDTAIVSWLFQFSMSINISPLVLRNDLRIKLILGFINLEGRSLN